MRTPNAIWGLLLALSVAACSLGVGGPRHLRPLYYCLANADPISGRPIGLQCGGGAAVEI